MTENKKNNRLSKRYDTLFYFSIAKDKGIQGVEDDFFGLLVDLSERGFRLKLNQEVELERVYNLSSQNPFAKNQEQALVFLAKSTWCRATEDNLFEAGFQFIDLNDENSQMFEKILSVFKGLPASNGPSPLVQKVSPS